MICVWYTSLSDESLLSDELLLLLLPSFVFAFFGMDVFAVTLLPLPATTSALRFTPPSLLVVIATAATALVLLAFVDDGVAAVVGAPTAHRAFTQNFAKANDDEREDDGYEYE